MHMYTHMGDLQVRWSCFCWHQKVSDTLTVDLSNRDAAYNPARAFMRALHMLAQLLGSHWQDAVL